MVGIIRHDHVVHHVHDLRREAGAHSSGQERCDLDPDRPVAGQPKSDRHPSHGTEHDEGPAQVGEHGKYDEGGGYQGPSLNSLVVVARPAWSGGGGNLLRSRSAAQMRLLNARSPGRQEDQSPLVQLIDPIDPITYTMKAPDRSRGLPRSARPASAGFRSTNLDVAVARVEAEDVVEVEITQAHHRLPPAGSCPWGSSRRRTGSFGIVLRPGCFGWGMNASERIHAMMRLGPLYEAVADTARAIGAYQRMADQWADGDERGLVVVRQSQARIAALGG